MIRRQGGKAKLQAKLSKAFSSAMMKEQRLEGSIMSTWNPAETMKAEPNASVRAKQHPLEAENQVHYFTNNDKSK